jgi:hypothetical protein
MPVSKDGSIGRVKFSLYSSAARGTGLKAAIIYGTEL